MPRWLVKLLEADGVFKTTNRVEPDGKLMKVKACPNMGAGIVQVLGQLLDQDNDVQYAYLCAPEVKHVSKLKKEGMRAALSLFLCIDSSRWILWLPQHSDVELLHYRSSVSRLQTVQGQSSHYFPNPRLH
jgi:hypothetical protein